MSVSDILSKVLYSGDRPKIGGDPNSSNNLNRQVRPLVSKGRREKRGKPRGMIPDYETSPNWRGFIEGIPEGATLDIADLGFEKGETTYDVPVLGPISPSREVGKLIGSLPWGGPLGRAGSYVARPLVKWAARQSKDWSNKLLRKGARRVPHIIGRALPEGVMAGGFEAIINGGDYDDVLSKMVEYTLLGSVADVGVRGSKKLLSKSETFGKIGNLVTKRKKQREAIAKGQHLNNLEDLSYYGPDADDIADFEALREEIANDLMFDGRVSPNHPDGPQRFNGLNIGGFPLASEWRPDAGYYPNDVVPTLDLTVFPALKDLDIDLDSKPGNPLAIPGNLRGVAPVYNPDDLSKSKLDYQPHHIIDDIPYPTDVDERELVNYGLNGEKQLSREEFNEATLIQRELKSYHDLSQVVKSPDDTNTSMETAFRVVNEQSNAKKTDWEPSAEIKYWYDIRSKVSEFANEMKIDDKLSWGTLVSGTREDLEALAISHSQRLSDKDIVELEEKFQAPTIMGQEVVRQFSPPEILLQRMYRFRAENTPHEIWPDLPPRWILEVKPIQAKLENTGSHLTISRGQQIAYTPFIATPQSPSEKYPSSFPSYLSAGEGRRNVSDIIDQSKEKSGVYKGISKDKNGNEFYEIEVARGGNIYDPFKVIREPVKSTNIRAIGGVVDDSGPSGREQRMVPGRGGPTLSELDEVMDLYAKRQVLHSQLGLKVGSLKDRLAKANDPDELSKDKIKYAEERAAEYALLSQEFEDWANGLGVDIPQFKGSFLLSEESTDEARKLWNRIKRKSPFVSKSTKKAAASKDHDVALAAIRRAAGEGGLPTEIDPPGIEKFAKDPGGKGSKGLLPGIKSIISPWSRFSLARNHWLKQGVESEMEIKEQASTQMNTWMRKYEAVKSIISDFEKIPITAKEREIATGLQGVGRRTVAGITEKLSKPTRGLADKASPLHADILRHRLHQLAKAIDDDAEYIGDLSSVSPTGEFMPISKEYLPAYNSYRSLMNEVADALGLPPGKRISSYLRHVFSGEAGSIRARRLGRRVVSSGLGPEFIDWVKNVDLDPDTRVFGPLLSRRANKENFEHDLDMVTGLYIRGAADKIARERSMRMSQEILDILPNTDEGVLLKQEWARYVAHSHGIPTANRKMVANFWASEQNILSRNVAKGVSRMIELIGADGDKESLRKLNMPKEEFDVLPEAEKDALLEGAQNFLTQLHEARRATDRVSGHRIRRDWAGHWNSSKSMKMRASIALQMNDVWQAIGNPELQQPVLREIYKVQMIAKLGLNLLHGAVNLTQTFTNLWPILKRGYVTKGMVDCFRTGNLIVDPETLKGRTARDLLEEAGIGDEAKLGQEYLDIFDTKRAFTKAYESIMAPSRLSENLNRRVAFLGAYRQFMDDGMGHLQSLTKARRLSTQTNFAFNPSGSPALINAPMPKLLLMFKSYPMHQINFTAELLDDAIKFATTKGKEGSVEPLVKQIIAYSSLLGAGAYGFSDTNFQERFNHPLMDAVQVYDNLTKGRDTPGAVIVNYLMGPLNDTIWSFWRGNFWTGAGHFLMPTLLKKSYSIGKWPTDYTEKDVKNVLSMKKYKRKKSRKSKFKGPFDKKGFKGFKGPFGN